MIEFAEFASQTPSLAGLERLHSPPFMNSALERAAGRARLDSSRVPRYPLRDHVNMVAIR